MAAGHLDPQFKPDFYLTDSTVQIKQQPQWQDKKKICTIDPWGHLPQIVFKDLIASGKDIRPSIAVTKAHIEVPELQELIR